MSMPGAKPQLGDRDTAILVVGSNRLWRAFLAEELADEGYTAPSVATADEALKALKANSPALLLLNTLNPIPQWTAFVGQVRRIAPALPVVVHTAFQLVPDIINPLLDLGVRRIVPKSTRSREILEAVSDVLRQDRS
jgi:DNA-binding response OmpR family regulator